MQSVSTHKHQQASSNASAEKTGNGLTLPAVSVFQPKTTGISGAAVIQPKWIDTGDEFLRWDSVIDGVRWYHHKEKDLMYFDTLSREANSAYGKINGLKNAKPREEWVKLHGSDPLEKADGSVKDAASEGSMTMDGYVLTPAYPAFTHEVAMLWNYFMSKNLAAKFAGRRIHIIKTGKSDKICHHWSFGGLNDGFDLRIDQIHNVLNGKDKDDFVLDEITWRHLAHPDGLQDYGSTSTASLRIYEGIDHSSRLKNGMYFHKFNGLPFIFAVEGGDDNLVYSSAVDIQLKVLNESGLGGASTFTYAPKL